MNKNLWIELDINSIEHNIRKIREHTNNKDIIAVVKSNAYGHGVLEIVSILVKNKINKFGVATLEEAIELRKEFNSIKIIIFGLTPLCDIEKIWEYNLEQSIFNYDYAYDLCLISKKYDKITNIHIKIDTGMGRLGFLSSDFEKIKNIYFMKNLNVVGIFSHFASSDLNDKTFSIKQFNEFLDIIKKLEDNGIKNIGIKHIANSGGILDLKNTYMDAIRPGKILYGYLPSDEIQNIISLKPVLTLKCRIIHIKYLEKDSNVGYGNIFKTKRKSKIAVLPIGYSDAYSKVLNNKIFVSINDNKAPVISICMNFCMIDITDIDNINIGDIVIVYGNILHIKEVSIETISKILGTNNYEVLCKINSNIPRILV